MGTNWNKYWRNKRHIRKTECDDLLGIDSFYIRENKKLWTSSREDHFAFNNYDEISCKRKIIVLTNKDELAFYSIESLFNGHRRTEGILEKDEFHVLVTGHFQSPVSGEVIYSRKELSYTIHLEDQKCNGHIFFRCPGEGCGLRMRKLYYSNGHFLCRKCLKLGYRSQRINPFDRIRFSGWKVFCRG